MIWEQHDRELATREHFVSTLEGGYIGDHIMDYYKACCWGILGVKILVHMNS